MDKIGQIKLPEKAPFLGDLKKEDLEDVVQLSISDEFKSIVNKANSEYLYWDRFKYIQLPDGVSPQAAWHALKLVRRGSTRTIPLPWSSKRLFSYTLPDITLSIFHQIDQNAAGNILVDVPNIHRKEKERYLMNSIVEEAIASSMIEGAATTRKKAREMLKKGRKPIDRAEQMIYNNYITISKIKDYLNEPLSPELLKIFQGAMTKDTLEKPDYEGRFRTEQDDIIEVADASGQVLHDPPKAGDIPELIEHLCLFANTNNEEEFIHPVLKGIILHFWLAYVHPFMDGNGRTARALFYWYLLKKKYWLFEYLSISRIILKAPIQYYRAFLYSEIDEGDMTYFIRFHLRAIMLALKELRIYLERKQEEAIDTARKLVRYPDINYRQKALMTNAIGNPDSEYTPRSHMRAHGVVYETARNDLLDLVDKGFLQKLKKGRGFTFLPVKDLEDKIRTQD